LSRARGDSPATPPAATSDEVKDLRREAQALKEVVADLENRLLKKSMGRRGMRYSASDKTEIIPLVEQSHLPARQMLEKLGILRSSFCRWYDRHRRGGPEALADRPSRPDRLWNRIPATSKPAALTIHKVYDIGWTPERYLFFGAASIDGTLKPAGLEKSKGLITGGYLKDATSPPAGRTIPALLRGAGVNTLIIAIARCGVGIDKARQRDHALCGNDFDVVRRN
jgi:transposase-like protein